MGTAPLRGIRVLEHGGKGPSQFGGMLLADLGADVIRVDRPTGLDRPMAGYDPRLDLLNRGRRSIALELRHEQGVALLLRLAGTVEAIVDPFRPGVAERLGVGPAECLAANPNLVYVRVTGWGGDGPYARTAGHDINFLAASGVLDLIGRAGGPPVPPLNLVGDFGGGGMLLALAVLSGVLAVRSGAVGQVVDVAMLDAAALRATVVHSLRAMGEWGPRGTNLLDTGAPYYDVYETADGGYVSVGAMERPFYEELLRGVRMAGDEAMLAAHHDRSRWPQASKRLADVFRTRTREEWSAVFAGRDACVEPVLDLDEAMAHPQVRHRGTYDSVHGVTQPAPAPRFGTTRPTVRRPPPRPGEHTTEILDALGLSQEDKSALIDAAVVR